MDDKVKELAKIIYVKWRDGFDNDGIAKAILEAGYVKPQPSLKFERITDKEIESAWIRCRSSGLKDKLPCKRAVADAQALSDEKQLAQHLLAQKGETARESLSGGGK